MFNKCYVFNNIISIAHQTEQRLKTLINCIILTKNFVKD